jgi:hypothetical protein
MQDCPRGRQRLAIVPPRDPYGPAQRIIAEVQHEIVDALRARLDDLMPQPLDELLEREDREREEMARWLRRRRRLPYQPGAVRSSAGRTAPARRCLTRQTSGMAGDEHRHAVVGADVEPRAAARPVRRRPAASSPAPASRAGATFAIRREDPPTRGRRRHLTSDV